MGAATKPCGCLTNGVAAPAILNVLLSIVSDVPNTQWLREDACLGWVNILPRSRLSTYCQSLCDKLFSSTSMATTTLSQRRKQAKASREQAAQAAFLRRAAQKKLTTI
jgi:hypothetical protein